MVAITGHGCPVDLDDAALVTGELFVNALMHGPSGGQVLTGYCLWRGGARIVVCDGGGPTTPELREADAGTEDGRGLHLVQELSARWGSGAAGPGVDPQVGSVRCSWPHFSRVAVAPLGARCRCRCHRAAMRQVKRDAAGQGVGW
jgi:hypothetical protein